MEGDQKYPAIAKPNVRDMSENLSLEILGISTNNYRLNADSENEGATQDSIKVTALVPQITFAINPITLYGLPHSLQLSP